MILRNYEEAMELQRVCGDVVYVVPNSIGLPSYAIGEGAFSDAKLIARQTARAIGWSLVLCYPDLEQDAYDLVYKVAKVGRSCAKTQIA